MEILKGYPNATAGLALGIGALSIALAHFFPHDSFWSHIICGLLALILFDSLWKIGSETNCYPVCVSSQHLLICA